MADPNAKRTVLYQSFLRSLVNYGNKLKPADSGDYLLIKGESKTYISASKVIA